jgi:hypothetical protein
MKVLLIDPPGPEGQTNRYLNTGLGYLAASLKKRGHQVCVLDFSTMRGDLDFRLDSALRNKPDIVGFSVYSITSRNVTAISEKS